MLKIKQKLKVIPYYTGKGTLEEALKDKRAAGLLWLEIIFNDSFKWEGYLNIQEIKDSYEKACIWYSNFRSLIQGHTKRKPLKRIEGKVDNREYRRFLEVLNFASTLS